MSAQTTHPTITAPSPLNQRSSSTATSSVSSNRSRSASTGATSVSSIDQGIENAFARAPENTVIVGMACRLPGAKNPSQLWNNIVGQKDLQRKVPEDRFNADAFYHPDGTNKGTTNAVYGYFLDDDVSEFDPEFFQISGKEAEAMDPQQRMLLEVVYEALEHAGITLEQISGTQTSVYCGCFTNDYRDMTNKDSEYYPKYNATGTGAAILSNRISYFYNLHGPSVTIDTACSSSLVGFHMGNQSIQNHEADISIVVGSALHLDPTIFTRMTDLGFLSVDGRCRAFDANGKGYVRGEGICAVILKRQSQASRDGNTIHAIVRGTGSNHDGLKEGITMPNSVAQEDLIRRVYKNSGLSTNETTYFEAHGTGTPAGDPRETRAIGAVFAPNRNAPLYVGSIKTNIGHLEGASGLAGIIKTTLSIKAGKILPNMLFKTPNPEIDFEKWKIAVPTKVLDWEPVNGVRRASINSFGYGGSNAHAILEGYYESRTQEETTPLAPAHVEMVKERPYLLPLTSHSEKAGKLLEKTLLDFAQESSDVTVADLAASLSEKGRSVHKYRSFVVAKDTETATEALNEPGTAWTQSANTAPRIGFVFTGQGAQWFAMGRQLIEKCPMFRQTIEQCDRVLQGLPLKPDWTCLNELTKNKQDSLVNMTALSTPLCAAVQVGVVDLLRAWGIKPSATVGHSAGEIAAAYAAGILSFEDAMVCAYYRGYSLAAEVEGRSTIPGAMLAVGMTEAEAIAELEPYKGKVCIGAVNSPSSLTLSGDEPAIVELKEKFEQRKVFARQLQVERAYHSHHIVPYAPLLSKLLKTIKPRPATCRMFSSVTARLAEPSKMGGDYFVANLTGQVRFSDALTGILLNEMEEENIDVLIEVGPHPALKGPSRQTIQGLKLNVPYLGTITRGEPDFEALLACAGQLYALGYPVDLEAVNSNCFYGADEALSQISAGKKISLPSYSWDHGKYWCETRVTKSYRFRKQRQSILGAPMLGCLETHPRWRNFLRPRELPWLSQHMIDGKVIFPAAGYISMAIEAATRMDSCPQEIKQILLRDVAIKSALSLSDSDMGTEVLLEIQPLSTSAKRTSDTWCRFVINSYSESGICNEHCYGLIAVEKGTPAPLETIAPQPSLVQLRKRTDRCASLQKYYDHLWQVGLQYGDYFRLISGNVESGSGFAMAPIVLRPDATITTQSDRCIIHPSFLDATLHPSFAGIESLLGRPLDEPFVPTFLRSLKISGAFHSMTSADTERRLWVTCETRLPGPRVAISDIAVRSEDGSDVLVEIQGFEGTALGGNGDDNLGRALFFRTRWQPAFDNLNGTKELANLDGIAQAMDIFAHQHPNSKILHVTADVEDVKEVLRHLGGRQGERRRFQSLSPFPFSSDAGTIWDEVSKEWPGLIDVTEPKEGDFDVVILSQAVETDVKTFLKPDGFIISIGVEFDAQGLTPLFQGSKVSAWSSQPAASSPDSLTLVVSPPVSEATEILASIISTRNNGPVSRVSLTDLVTSTPMSDNLVVLSSLDENIFFDNTEGQVTYFEALQKLLTSSGKNVVWVLRGAYMESSRPEQAMVSGMARVVRNENEKIKFVVLDVSETTDSEGIYQQIKNVFQMGFTEDEVAERDGTLFIPRLEADDDLNSRLPVNASGDTKLQRFGEGPPLTLKIGKVGLLETLAFGIDEEILDGQLADDELEIEVKASAINFRDIAASIGIIDDYKLGDECSGVVIRTGSKVDKSEFKVGDRVVAWRPGQGAHKNIVRNPASCCVRFEDMSFVTAAAFSGVTMTAYYAFYDLGRVQPGEYVLVHAAAGGVGQMAVQMAQNIGAKVIATCGSQPKRDLLKSCYGLTDDHIFSSRDDSFVKDILRLTNGKGVDVVLNSLAGDLLHATWSCMARFGRYIEIGKRDIHENAKIDMEPFRRNVSFASLDLITVFEYNKPLGARMLRECARQIEQGILRVPESVIELPYSQTEKGFRLLQMGKHTGKIVLVPHKDDMVRVIAPVFRPTTIFNPAKVYLLSGGLGGLGRTLSEWMVRNGARNLAFLSRSGTAKAEAKATVDWLEARDVNVTVFKSDVSNPVAVKACVDSLGNQLGGVFHAAVVLQDALLEKMTYQQWRTCVEAKVRGAYNLHIATLHLGLDFFIPFSSASAVFGTIGQTNYSAANAYLDALIRHRRELGLKGSTMNCGMIVGVGLVAENADLEKLMISMGSDPVNEEELLYQIREAIESGSKPPTSARGVDLHATVTGVNLSKKDFYWVSRSLFRNLYANHDVTGAASNGKSGTSLASMLQNAATAEDRAAVLTEAFIEKIAAVLGVAAETVKPNNPLSMYGLDSIVAVEFRKWFSKTINVNLALFDILSSKSIGALVTKAAGLMVIDAVTSDQGKSKAEGAATTGAATTLEQSASGDAAPSFEPTSRPNNIPMSTFQRRMWFAHSMVEDRSSLNLAVSSHLKGKPNREAIKQTMDELKKRNEMLRTSYFEGEDFAEQKPIEDFDSRMVYEDLSSLDNPEKALEEFVEGLRKQELDIEEGEVMRSALIKLGEERYVQTNVYHHIAIDRGSSRALLEQVTSLYDAIRTGKDLASVPPPRISYIDFAVWYEKHLQSDALQEDLQFWQKKLAGASTINKLLPFAQSERPESMDNARSIHKMTLGLAMLKRMKRVCAQMGTTPLHFLLAAFRSFLYRYNEQEDLTILLIDGNRPRPDLEDVLGFFVNMIPVRMNEELEGGFDRLLTRSKEATVEAIKHSNVPFDAIVEAVKVEKSREYFPLSQVVVNYQMHGKVPRFHTTDFEVTGVENEDIPTACEMALEALEDPERGLDLRLEYSTTLYAEEEMYRFFDNFLAYMTSLIQDHRQPIAEVPMCGPAELQHLSSTCWNTAFVENKWNHASIVNKILQNVQAHPDALAVQTADGSVMSYKDLISQARGVAASLNDLNAVPGQSIGILSRPGADSIVAMVGVLLTGCGYLPMDPDFAVERLSFMASDSAVPVILVGEDLQATAGTIAAKIALSPRTMSIPDAKKGCSPSEANAWEYTEASPNDPFYTIYTSGSTGNPKGVVLTQSNTQQMLSSMQHDYCFNSEDKFLHQSSMSFDLSIVQIFSALTSGAAVCVASSEIRKNPVLLAKVIKDSAVTVTYFTPTHFALLIEHAASTLTDYASYRLAYFAGERLTARLVDAFHCLNTPATVLNTWSPSELVVQTTVHKVANPRPDTLSIPIGRPLANCRHYIVDSRMNPLPPTLVGEICVGGGQVGAGYLNRPDVNAHSFVEDPFCGEDDRSRGWTRVFRTGDRGRFFPSGELEFHGRIAGDKQIKLRGFRIDLGEVEHRIYEESSNIAGGKLIDVSMVARAIGETAALTDERQLIAFIVSNHVMSVEQQKEYVTAIQQGIGAHLNSYMLPNGYQFLAALPVTVGGKVDIKDLQKRDLELTFPSTAAAPSQSEEVEAKVLKTTMNVFSEVLKFPKGRVIAPTDSFFELGGQSILLLRLQAKLKRHYKTVPTLPELFKAPTPMAIAQKICSKGSTTSRSKQVKDEQRNVINWLEESQLPTDKRFVVSYGVESLSRSEVTEILVTGVDSFVGYHLLANILLSRSAAKVYVLGSDNRVEGADVLNNLEQYRLLSTKLTKSDVLDRVRCVPGTLSKAHFDLSNAAFNSLARSIQVIYHLGGHVSLLQNYDHLKATNRDATLDVIELAAGGLVNTEIHYLSTWSVAHLQSHVTARRRRPDIDTSENKMDHFLPADDSELAYFKLRWASEMLLTEAARRGFSISIFRASTVTGSTVTDVPEPDDDFVRRVVLDMIEAGSVPKLGSQDTPGPVVDFVPINYLTNVICDITGSEEVRSGNTSHDDTLSIYHIGNPSPLHLEDLPALMAKLRPDGKTGSTLPLQKWLTLMKDNAHTPAAQLRCAAMNRIFESGHTMFALDGTKTRRALETVGGYGANTCPSVDDVYLRRMMSSRHTLSP